MRPWPGAEAPCRCAPRPDCCSLRHTGSPPDATLHRAREPTVSRGPIYQHRQPEQTGALDSDGVRMMTPAGAGARVDGRGPGRGMTHRGFGPGPRGTCPNRPFRAIRTRAMLRHHSRTGRCARAFSTSSGTPPTNAPIQALLSRCSARAIWPRCAYRSRRIGSVNNFPIDTWQKPN